MNKKTLNLKEKIDLILLNYYNLVYKLSSMKPDINDVVSVEKSIKKIMPIININNDINRLSYIKYERSKSLENKTESEIDFGICKLQKTINDMLNEQGKDKEVQNIVFEIRSGTGGDEASIFANELWNMYSKFFDKEHWKYKVLSYSGASKKGIKEVVLTVKGKSIYKYLENESGTHRVQRIPVTESQGRIHTSTCTVAVLPMETSKRSSINACDLRIDVYRASGPGGQSVNTTDSAVRVTHIPTGIVVQCQDEKSQLRNKIAATKVLEVKLQKYYSNKEKEERSKKRKSLIKSGERSEKVRTYNFPKDKCTDHRSGVVVYNLCKLFSGNIHDLINKNFLFLNRGCGEGDLNSHDFYITTSLR